MALSDKNILITPNRSQTADPKIEFVGASSILGPQTITLRVYPTSSGTVSLEGSAGQLFSVTNTLTGTIYSVNDVSGIPSIEVLDTGLVKFAQYSGNVLIGTGTDTGEAKLQVTGGGFFTGSIGNSRTAKGVYVGLSLGGDPQIQLQGNGATSPHIDFDNGTGDFDMRIVLTGDDTLNITGGSLTVETNTVLHAGNYNSYSPTLTGGNASGTWTINITGNAATINSQANSATITASTGVNANDIVRRDGSGYIYANHVNFNTGVENPAIANLITDNGDGWSRKSSLDHVKNSIRGVADGTWSINITGNSGTTSQREFSGDISSGGQGRFTGWYTGNAGSGTAAEIGMSSGEGYVFVYNRANGIYGTLNIAASGANMKFSGSTINVNSGALQQGGNQVLHASNYSSYALPLGGGVLTGRLTVNVNGRGTSYSQSNLEVYTSDNTRPGISFHSGGYSATILYENDGELYTNPWITRGQTGKLLAAGNYNSYAPTLTGGGASGTWGINITGNAASATNAGYANSAGSAASVAASAITGQTGMWTSTNRPGPYRLYRREDDTNYSVQTYWTGSYWRLYGYSGDSAHADTHVGYADSAGSSSSSGSANYLYSADRRIIAPSEDAAYRMRFGFTSWNNNNTSPWADYLHLRSYTDSTGGSDNLVMFRKEGGIGMRIWQQTFGSSTAYASYVDVLTSGNYSSYALPLSGGTMTGSIAMGGNNVTGAGLFGLGNGFQIQQGGSDYGRFNSWVHLNGYYGFYASINSAHIYPNNGAYGTWRMDGSRNGWAGIQFGVNNGNVNLMIETSSNSSGFYNENYGWQFRWENGTAYVNKNSYGGGTQATVLDSSNYNSYSPTLTGGGASGTWNINITGNAATATSATDSTKVPLTGGTMTGTLFINSKLRVNTANQPSDNAYGTATDIPLLVAGSTRTQSTFLIENFSNSSLEYPVIVIRRTLPPSAARFGAMIRFADKDSNNNEMSSEIFTFNRTTYQELRISASGAGGEIFLSANGLTNTRIGENYAVYLKGANYSVTTPGALDIDCRQSNYFTKTISSDSTFTFSNVTSLSGFTLAYSFTLELTHTSGTITWPSTVKWPGNTAPSLTTGKTHLFMFVTDDAGSRWRGSYLTNYDN